MTRRAALRLVGIGGAGLAVAPLLAACGTGAPPAPTAAPAKPTDAPKPAAPAAPAPAPAPAASPAPATAASPAPASAAAAAASPAAAAPAPTSAPVAATGQPPVKELVIGLTGDISTFDPGFASQTLDYTMINVPFDTLTYRAADLKLYPRLATEWTLINDTTWQFKLRRDAKFHNGAPLTSKDVKFSIERTWDPAAKTLVAVTYATVDRIETPDDYSVTFIMKKPDPLLPARLAILGGQILPTDYFKEVGPDTFKVKPIGSGPYKLVEWVKDDHTTYGRVDDYWGGKALFETVRAKPLPEVAARVAALLAGEAHIIRGVPPDQIDRINNSGKARVVSTPFQGIYNLVVNSNVPPLDNKLVKQALSWAIDRPTIIKSLYRDQASPVSGLILEGSVGFDPSLPPLGFDQAKARALLQQAGYKGEEIILESSTNITNEQQLAESIVQMWKQVGVNARQEVIEASVRAQKFRDKSFKGLWLSDWGDVLVDPDGMLWRLLAPGALFDYWRDPEFDKLGEEARFTVDQKLRETNYKRMNQIILEHFPAIPLYRPNELYGVANFIDWKPFGWFYMDLRADNLKLRA